ncbi:MAG: efflux RND transporter periplasmic adaptor subunit, partial [Janthinobacterium lividum]
GRAIKKDSTIRNPPMAAPSHLHLALLLAVLAAPAMGQTAGVPVTTTAPRRQDVPVVARSIGTVQAAQSVVIRARVDGTLDRVLFTEGQLVHPGDVLAQLDPRPYQAILDQAVAKKASDEAGAASTRSDLQRYADLAASQVASRQKLEQIRAAVVQAEAAVRGDDASIAAAALNLGFTRITSPIEGRVGLRQVDAGNFIRAADPATTGIVTVAQIHPVSLVFTLPQDILPQVQAAMRRAKLPVAAYSSDDRTRLSEGELLTLDSSIDAATGTIKLKAVFANADDNLWPGQFVNVRMRLDLRGDALTVPSQAVQRGANGLYVYVIKPDGTALAQTVEVDQDDGTVAVIAKGLDGNERVVLAGQSRLSNGARVSVNDAKPAS